MYLLKGLLILKVPDGMMATNAVKVHFAGKLVPQGHVSPDLPFEKIIPCRSIPSRLRPRSALNIMVSHTRLVWVYRHDAVACQKANGAYIFKAKNKTNADPPPH